MKNFYQKKVKNSESSNNETTEQPEIRSRRKTLVKLDMNTICEDKVDEIPTPEQLKSRLSRGSFSIRTLNNRLYSIDLNNENIEETLGDSITENQRENENLDNVIEHSDDENADFPVLSVKVIIIDCTPISYIDSVGVQTLQQVCQNFLLFASILKMCVCL
jgi:hypothetical protein